MICILIAAVGVGDEVADGGVEGALINFATQVLLETLFFLVFAVDAFDCDNKLFCLLYVFDEILCSFFLLLTLAPTLCFYRQTLKVKDAQCLRETLFQFFSSLIVINILLSFL